MTIRPKQMMLFFLIALVFLITGCAGLTSLTIQKNFRDIADKTLPVVVQVNTVDIFSQEVPDLDGWDFFFPDPDGEGESEEREFRTQGLGSGVIVRRNGDTYYVVTNNHVVGEADEVSITLHNGRIYPADLIGKDPRRDLALVSFSAPGVDIQEARLGDSDSLRIGDLVVALGNPFGYSGTVTQGIISGLHRSGPTDISDFIQTDASINQGNSGGALVDLKGRVIGINTWITTPTGGSIGLGFAIPINSARNVIDQLIETGQVAYGWLGVSITDTSHDILESMKEDDVSGAVVTNIYVDSPAEKAGIRPGDIILNVGRRRIKNADNLIQAVSDLPVSRNSDFVILRDGESLEIPVAIEERADDDTIRARSDKFWPGLRLYPITDALREEMEKIPERGVYVLAVDKGTPGESAGLKSGDVITRLGKTEIDSLDAFYSSLKLAEDQALAVSVHRGGEDLELMMGPMKQN
ncbi:Do family serine endopeptidase [Marispirochaeta aestuarii]|uniref:Do family serine endopeptidase n=1 Tax=Marispirochaeta aestuarii TaxID=1963862 RepID=UPI0029C7EDAB|nr:Do family serine endopeptidase [Marispirochaeta aestuarii]